MFFKSICAFQLTADDLVNGESKSIISSMEEAGMTLFPEIYQAAVKETSTTLGFHEVSNHFDFDSPSSSLTTKDSISRSTVPGKCPSGD